MERKYYLRGLGLGIAVTAIIMSVALPDNQTMTNDEIIARAKELGLVENTVLSNTGNADGSQESEADDRADAPDTAVQPQDDLATAGSDIDTESEMEDAAAKEDGDAADEAEEEIAPEADNAEQEDVTVREENTVGTENTNEVITSTTVKVITVNSGDSSYTVAKKLADVGVVTSAQSFDTFLCQNGYDKRLRTGSFSIPTDASDEQIARIVTGLE